MITTHAAPARVGTVWHLLTAGRPGRSWSGTKGAHRMGKHSADVPAFMTEPATALEAFVDATLPELTPATPDDRGCWVDGVRGWRSIPHMIDVAVSRGWPIEPSDDVILEQYGRNGTLGAEAIAEIADDAEKFLNDHIAPEGFAFGWYEGDFMLWSEADWCNVSGERCWCVNPHPVG